MRYRYTRIGCALGAAVLLSLSAASAEAHHGPAHAHAAPAATPCTPAPFGPYANHAAVAPPFQWGWFGAQHFYPRVQWGRDYNGDVLRWSKHRRY